MQTFPTPLSLWDQHIRPRVSSQPHRLRTGFIHVNKTDDFELSAHDESLKKPSTCTCTIKRLTCTFTIKRLTCTCTIKRLTCTCTIKRLTCTCTIKRLTCTCTIKRLTCTCTINRPETHMT